jgi:predicted HD superfamily hydrolase involved in NAD metabolism
MTREAGREGERLCIQAGWEERWQDLRDKLAGVLQAQRFKHSLGTADEAVIMSRSFGGDPVKLALAGLLHDRAKELGNERLLALGEAQGLITDPAERESPSLLHGPVGAWLVSQEWGVEDPVILEAIRLHTTGGPAMSREACIIFMADLIEPSRDYEGVEVLRRLCRRDLRAAMIEAIEQVLINPGHQRKSLHQGSLRCLAWLNEERGTTWIAKN